MSTIFSWNPADIEALLASCDVDDVTLLARRWLPPGGTVLESGCGLGRYVRYLTDRGWPTVGLEWLGETVRTVHAVWPDLRLVQGDSSSSPFPDASFDGLLSLGVVEHWIDGPASPLCDHYRVLKPGGIAIITVPLHNRVREIKRRLWLDEVFGFPRAVARRVLRGHSLRLTRRHPGRYAIHPAYGDFFEYRMTVEQFLAEVRSAGFEILDHVPTGSMDGLYHDLNPLGVFVKFRQWKFEVSPLARWLDAQLSRRPFYHSHMQAVAVRKPLG